MGEFVGQIVSKAIAIFVKVKELSFVSWLIGIVIGACGYYLEMIGYPSDAISFIFFLVVSDFVTRIIAQVVHANEEFSKMYKTKNTFIYVLKLIAYAFKTKAISSRKFYSGFFVKSISYTVLLVIAHYASHLTMIPMLNFIPVVIYGGLIIYDIISNLENLSEIGFAQASGLLTIFKKKKQQLEEDTLPYINNSINQTPTTDTTTNVEPEINVPNGTGSPDQQQEQKANYTGHSY